MRVGMGYDVHKLTEDRKLILGGVEIPYDKGLLGHSDADVLLHAIMDALLGAAALGDIGRHFPDTDPEYKGASSMKLLEHVGKLVEDKLYVIGNIDATIIAQRPKMAPHIEAMRENVANVLHIDIDQVNIKATTEEGLGFTGSGEGMSAQAIAQRSTIMRKTHSDNELFTFRVWLVRLGLNGDEFRETRDLLLAHLDGDRAWRFDKDSYEVNRNKKKKHREAER